MEQLYFRFDKDGYYIEPVIVNETYTDENPMPDDLTEVIPPDGLYRAMFNGMEWVEAGDVPIHTKEELAKQARIKRDLLLAKGDYTQLLDNQLTDEQQVIERAYRQALRDIPQQEGFPFEIVWPEVPVLSL